MHFMLKCFAISEEKIVMVRNSNIFARFFVLDNGNIDAKIVEIFSMVVRNIS